VQAADSVGDARRRAVVVEYLLEIAGPDMYRQNVFQRTGLSTAADGRTVRERRQRTTTLAQSGDEKAKALLSSFDDLRDEQRRLVQELFWYWDVPEATCGCPRGLHAAHDAAVRQHAKALRLENGSPQRGAVDQAWVEAADKWAQVQRRAALWGHVRHRIERLGDRRMDEQTVEALRDALPRALLRPVIDLAMVAKAPARLVAHAREWDDDAGLADDLLTEAAEPLLADVRTAMDAAVADLDADRPTAAAKVLRASVLPKVRRLDVLLPHDVHRETGRLLDRVAILFNNSALALAQAPSSGSESTISDLFDLALALAVAPQQRTIIKQNADGHRALRAADKELAPYGGFEKASLRVTQCIQDGLFAEARSILVILRRHATDPAEIRQIDSLLAQLRRLLDRPSVYSGSRASFRPAVPSRTRGGGVVSWPRAVLRALRLCWWVLVVLVVVLGPLGMVWEIVAGLLWCLLMITLTVGEHRRRG
jgi:hypothetical protein